MRPPWYAFIAAITALAPASYASDWGLRTLRSQTHVDGASCSFRITGQANRDVLQWDFSSAAWVNLGREDVLLKLTKSKETPLRKDKNSVGDSRVLRFSADDLRVTIRTKTTWVCPAGDEDCEVWKERGSIRVEYDRADRTWPVTGTCGS